MRRNAIATGTDPGRRVGRSGARRGPNELLDGDCEAVGVADWGAVGCTVAKSTTNPHGGSRCLQISTPSGSKGYAQQSVYAGTYRLTAWCRGDGGSGYVRIYCSAAASPVIFESTTSTTWQLCSQTIVVSGTTALRFYQQNNSVSSCCIDDFYLERIA